MIINIKIINANHRTIAMNKKSYTYTRYKLKNIKIIPPTQGTN